MGGAVGVDVGVRRRGIMAIEGGKESVEMARKEEEEVKEKERKKSHRYRYHTIVNNDN